MEKLVRNITRLIALHNCVIIPGVGALLAHRVPAYYSAKEKVFMPPHRSLAFNPQVTLNDALLQSEYMADGLMSFDEASECLANDIDKLRIKLSEAGVVCLGDLGTFTMDIDGKIAFTPNANGIDDPCNFGFEPLVIAPLSELKKKDIVIKRSSISKYVSAVAAAIVAIFVLIPFGNSIYNNDIQLSIAGFAPVENTAKAVVAETTVTEAVAVEDVCDIAPVEETVTEHIFTAPVATEEATEVAVTTTETAPVAETETVKKTKQYSIIVASTPNPENAQLAISQLSRKMKADYKVVEGDRRFRIAIESYDNEADASIALQRVHETFSDAWICIH